MKLRDHKIVLKECSDEMRAFYDFYIDFLGEKDAIESELSEIDITNWCEDSGFVNMAILSAKNQKRKLKP